MPWALLGRATALAVLMGGLPLLAAFALAIRLSHPGPVLFAQEREGSGGARFRMWKLRTMVADAEDVLRRRLLAEPRLAAEWRRFGCLRDDPRVAGPVARLARRLSVDELPQLWNVARGEMALVGPRPLPPGLAASLPPAARARRNGALPGMTGLWQVRRRSEVDLRGMARYDAFYARRKSARLDLWILLLTPAAVLSRRGAY
jgi:lipopolysaccharide/colanic/teichoic acid biosynthesis glycosyltransferase